MLESSWNATSVFVKCNHREMQLVILNLVLLITFRSDGGILFKNSWNIYILLNVTAYTCILSDPFFLEYDMLQIIRRTARAQLTLIWIWRWLCVGDTFIITWRRVDDTWWLISVEYKTGISCSYNTSRLDWIPVEQSLPTPNIRRLQVFAPFRSVASSISDPDHKCNPNNCRTEGEQKTVKF